MTHADLVLAGGKILTLDPKSRIVQALAVRGDRIAALGTGADIAPLIGPDTRRIDLRGRLAVPGLFDGHAHLDREGLKLKWPSPAGARSIEDILQIVEGLVRRAAPGEWIVTMPIGESRRGTRACPTTRPRCSPRTRRCASAAGRASGPISSSAPPGRRPTRPRSWTSCGAGAAG